MSDPGLTSQHRQSILKIVGVYVAVSVAWIVSSDILLGGLFDRGRMSPFASIVKGFGFIAVTAWMLAWLLARQFRRLAVAEAARQAQAGRLSAIAEILPTGVYMLDTQGRITFANRAIRDLFDAPQLPGNLVDALAQGWFFTDWSGRPLQDAELPGFSSMRENKPIFDRRYLVTSPGGRKVYVSVNATPLAEPGGRVTGVVLTVSDMTRLQQQRAELERRGRVLSMVTAVERELTRHHPEKELMDAICRAIVDEGGYRLAWIGLVSDDAARTVHVVAAHGVAADVARRQRLEALPGAHGGGPTGRAIRERRTVVCDDIASDADFLPWREAALANGMSSMLSVPLFDDRDAVIGTLGVFDAKPGAFHEAEVTLIETLAKDLSYGIVSGRSNAARRTAEARYETVLSGVLLAMAKLLEIRDPYTAGHEMRTAQVCLAVGHELGLDPGTLEGLRIAAELHDIGKMVVPAEILSRPARLTKTEMEIVKQHPGLGEEVLSSIEFAWPIATIVGQHHERLDGSGYPRGLKGDQIRLESRILAVSDTYEAITSHRPHRPARGPEDALVELRQGAGRFYDPVVVEALERVVKRHGADTGQWVRPAFAPPSERSAT